MVAPEHRQRRLETKDLDAPWCCIICEFTACERAERRSASAPWRRQFKQWIEIDVWPHETITRARLEYLHGKSPVTSSAAT
ncbi:hypothetical protein PC128_g26492 [Phytophthora cactorum]|nr:hypothetical protein PC120_g26416 [Phytophthora cactorum]KAG3132248.1 hypothetical protein PC128_g26492 [Phytophthora cactorum]KAG4037136.1 hypothetical protein PC123_g27297 [Phytophthora cactorum]